MGTEEKKIKELTDTELIAEYIETNNSCFWSDMSSDCGSLGSGRDRELFRYRDDLLSEIRKRGLSTNQG